MSDTNTARIGIDEFRGRHRGLDVWIIDGAASPDFFAFSHLKGKITVGINRVFKRMRTTYLIQMESNLSVDDRCSVGCPIIMPEFECGDSSKRLNQIEGAYYFQHADKPDNHMLELSLLGRKKLIVGGSAFISAIHFACELGARNVLCCGSEGRSSGAPLCFERLNRDAIESDHRGCTDTHSRQLDRVQNALQEHYGCRIFSLSPHIGSP